MHSLSDGAVHPHVKYTAREYALLDDGKRWELWDGELVPMSPAPNCPHQSLLVELAFLLSSFLRRVPLGRAWVAPLDVYLGRHDVVQPDLIFVARRRLKIMKRRGCEGSPDLAVEILSSEPVRDRDVKFKTYARFGVGEYWIIDPEARSIEVYREPEKDYVLWRSFSGAATLTSPTLPGFELPVADLFAVLDEDAAFMAEGAGE